MAGRKKNVDKPDIVNDIELLIIKSFMDKENNMKVVRSGEIYITNKERANLLIEKGFATLAPKEDDEPKDTSADEPEDTPENDEPKDTSADEDNPKN